MKFFKFISIISLSFLLIFFNNTFGGNENSDYFKSLSKLEEMLDELLIQINKTIENINAHIDDLKLKLSVEKSISKRNEFRDLLGIYNEKYFKIIIEKNEIEAKLKDVKLLLNKIKDYN